ncbi:MAG TPA: hypothetical protein VM580_10400 [Labilithrix sp.]|nr:hypothetical protein [Labilithrix sp.]
MSDDTEVDAVALFRPKSFERLRPFLDLDDESEECNGLYAEMLEDGSVLVHTFQPYAPFEQDPEVALEWLLQFGDALPEVHADPRGMLFFPHTCEPEGQSYDAIVEEVEDDGVWIEVVDDDEDAGMVIPADALPPGIDIGKLQQLAGQLLGGEATTGPLTSFDIGRLFQGVQNELLTALETQGADTLETSEESSGADSSDDTKTRTPTGER